MSSFVEPVKQHHWANMNYIIEPNKQLQKPLDDISFRIWEIIEPIWKTTEPIRITLKPLWITLLSQYQEHFWANMKNFHKPSGSLAHLAQFWLNLGKFGSLARLALRWLSFFFSKYRADEPGVIFLEMQNSFWYSLFSIIQPTNVFFQNSLTLDLWWWLIL